MSDSEQQLAQVFDYTAWHQFVVKVDRANGDGWQLLTRKLHGALSGGEKAIAPHLPLFAAVDLDLVLTSDHEWCTYADLSGIGIHQPITGDDRDDAVTTARFTWNGHSLLPEEPSRDP